MRIKRNPTIVVNFEFINTGTEPLVITKGDPSCSCLSANYPQAPINPNCKGNIIITINTQGQNGDFSNTIIIKSNSYNPLELLRIKGVLK